MLLTKFLYLLGLIKGIKPSRDDFDDNHSASAQTPKTSVPKTGGTSATTA